MEEPPHPDGARASRIGLVPHEEWQATHRDPTQASLALAHELAAEFGKAREPSRETLAAKGDLIGIVRGKMKEAAEQIRSRP